MGSSMGSSPLELPMFWPIRIIGTPFVLQNVNMMLILDVRCFYALPRMGGRWGVLP